MKYIREFDKYSDDELSDLIGDLSDIGHQSHLIQGKDFGFRPNFQGENNGENILFLTGFSIEQMEKSNLLAPPLQVIPYRLKRSLMPKVDSPRIKIYQDGYFPTESLKMSKHKDQAAESDGLYYVSIESVLTNKKFPIITSFSIHKKKGMDFRRQEIIDIYNDFVNLIKQVKVQ